jgi:hypothetical protein
MQQDKLRQWLANLGSGYADIFVGSVILLLTPVVIRTFGVENFAVWILCHSILFYLGFFDIGSGHACRYLERFNKTYREKVQQVTDDWLTDCDELLSHESLGRVPPLTFMPRDTKPGESSYNSQP